MDTCRNRKISVGIWIAITAVCTAIMIFFAVTQIRSISSLAADRKQFLAQAYVDYKMIEFFRKNIATFSINLTLIAILYTSFAVLAAQKLISSFRPELIKVPAPKNKNVIRAVWIVCAVVCTAIILYLAIDTGRDIYGTIRFNAYIISTHANDAQFAQELNSETRVAITYSSICLVLMAILYASFAVLATKKLISLFRPPVETR